MTAVTIPADLAADIAARPKAYRPQVAEGDEVIGFRWLDDPAREFAIGPASLRPGQPWLDVRTFDLGVHLTCAAWALVGSVDGGPRPNVGDQLLILECSTSGPDHVGAIGTVGSIGTIAPPSTVIPSVGTCCPVRWAILPPAPAACCDLHGRTCEPPSELCCRHCTEGAHPAHADGSTCSAPDLSGTGA